MVLLQYIERNSVLGSHITIRSTASSGQNDKYLVASLGLNSKTLFTLPNNNILFCITPRTFDEPGAE